MPKKKPPSKVSLKGPTISKKLAQQVVRASAASKSTSKKKPKPKNEPLRLTKNEVRLVLRYRAARKLARGRGIGRVMAHTVMPLVDRISEAYAANPGSSLSAEDIAAIRAGAEVGTSTDHVHACHYSSQPYITVLCQSQEYYVYQQPDGLPEGVYRADWSKGKPVTKKNPLYTFDDNKVTCAACLAKIKTKVTPVRT